MDLRSEVSGFRRLGEQAHRRLLIPWREGALQQQPGMGGASALLPLGCPARLQVSRRVA